MNRPDDDDIEQFGTLDVYDYLMQELDDTEEEDVVIDFIDDIDGPSDYSEAEKRASNALGEYSFEEVLSYNDMDDLEALTLLFVGGYVGLPAVIEEDLDEESESVSPEEDEE